MTHRNERTKKAEHVRVARVTRSCYTSDTFVFHALHVRVPPTMYRNFYNYPFIRDNIFGNCHANKAVQHTAAVASEIASAANIPSTPQK